MSSTRAANELSAVEAASMIDSGALTCEALMAACLERVLARDGHLKSFVSIDPDRSLRQARALDRAGAKAGPLYGLPIGVKDVFETEDLPTQMGSPIYEGYHTRADAAVVAQARSAGGIVLGKTATCEFAGMAPAATLNPLDPDRTPGGSSSGSAAAVADFMLPLAFGTQTGGSMLRPASYCGVIGYKPTYGTFSRQGLKFAAENLDTVGLFARTVEDVAFFADGLLRRSYQVPRFSGQPRIGICRTYLWDMKAQPETKEIVEKAALQAEAAGADVVVFDLPESFADLTAARETINDVERSRSLAWEWHHHRDMISPQLSRSIESGLRISQERYVSALRRSEEIRIAFDDLCIAFDGLIAPCVNGEAPVGLDYTGDPAFQGLWTLLHVPTLALPAGRGPNGMPVALQIVGGRDRDRKVLALASWLRDQAGITLPE